MSANEVCRTDSLSGHVAGCTKCGDHHNAYTSFKNRHSPKRQGPVARNWMEARAEDLLPLAFIYSVHYFQLTVKRIRRKGSKLQASFIFPAGFAMET